MSTYTVSVEVARPAPQRYAYLLESTELKGVGSNSKRAWWKLAAS